MKKLLVFLLFFHYSWCVSGQNKKILDSLFNIYQTTTKDTLKVITLADIAYEYRRTKPDTCITLARKALAQSEALGYKKGKARSYRSIGVGYYIKSDYPAALDYYNKSLALCKETNEKNTEASLLNNIGLIHNNQSNYPLALVYYDKSLKIYEATKNEQGIATNLNNIGLIYSNQGLYARALEYHQKSLVLREKIKEKRGIASSLGNIAIVYHVQGKNMLALDYYQKSLKIHEELQDKLNMANTLNNISDIYQDEGRFAYALTLREKALQIFEELNNKRGIAGSWKYIAGIYLAQKKYDMALVSYQKGAKINEEIKNKQGIAECLKDMGLIYCEQKNYATAFEQYQKSLKIYEDIKNQWGVASVLHYLADLYLVQKKYDESIEYAQKSLKIAKELEILSIANSLADILYKAYKNKEMYTKALEYHELFKQTHDSLFSIEKSRKIANLEAVAEVEKNQKEIQLLEKDKKMQEIQVEREKNARLAIEKQAETDRILALAKNEKDKHKQDSLYRIAQQKQLEVDKHLAVEQKLKAEAKAHSLEILKEKEATEFQQKLTSLVLAGLFLMAVFAYFLFRSRQKEKKAKELIDRQKTEVLQQKEEITTQAEEMKTLNDQLVELDHFKQNLTSMIVHDLKNPLNALLNLSDTPSLEQNQLVKGYSTQMLQLVLNILDVQKFEEAKMVLDKQEASLVSVLLEACRQVEFIAHQKNIQFQIQASPSLYAYIDIEIIIRIWVNLLTNALKYSPQNAIIILTIREQEQAGKAYCSVQDEGKGIPADKLDLVFQKFEQLEPTMRKSYRSTGLGLTYCKLAVEAHGGEIGVSSEVGKGATFWFSLPDIWQGEAPNESHFVPTVATTLPTLNEANQAILAPFLPALSERQVYYTSELENILSEIDFEQNENLYLWGNQLKEAIHNFNQELYTRLLSQIKP